MKKIIDTKVLIELYQKGYFPMAKSAREDDIHFYRPKDRFIIPINKFHIPKKLLSNYKNNKFQFKINFNFETVIFKCSLPRKKDKETWINQIILNTYIDLYKKGFAKSIECYYENKIIAGLYGLHIGSCFFGESMYTEVNNASKFCLLLLISILKENKFILLDSQFYNRHLIQFGAYEIPDKKYQIILKEGLNEESKFPNITDFQKSVYILQSLSHKS